MPLSATELMRMSRTRLSRSLASPLATGHAAIAVGELPAGSGSGLEPRWMLLAPLAQVSGLSRPPAVADSTPELGACGPLGAYTSLGTVVCACASTGANRTEAASASSGAHFRTTWIMTVLRDMGWQGEARGGAREPESAHASTCMLRARRAPARFATPCI